MRGLKDVNVLFLAEWMGNPIGTERFISSSIVSTLEKRGVVQILNENEDESMFEEIDEEVIEQESKMIDSPPVNKMVNGSPENKSFKKKQKKNKHSK